MAVRETLHPGHTEKTLDAITTLEFQGHALPPGKREAGNDR